MKTIQSKNYRYKEIIKISTYDPDVWSQKLQNITNRFSNGEDIYKAINEELPGLSGEQIGQVKDFVKGSLYQTV